MIKITRKGSESEAETIAVCGMNLVSNLEHCMHNFTDVKKL